MIIKIIIYIIFAVVTQKMTYKYIKRIDKKERKKLKNWEQHYIGEYTIMWKNEHFKQLVMNKKLKDYETSKKEENKIISDKLNQVKIEDDFEKSYNLEVDNATKKLDEELNN